MNWELEFDDICSEIDIYYNDNGTITGLDYEIIKRYIEAAEQIRKKKYSAFAPGEWKTLKYGELVANEKANQDTQRLMGGLI